MNITEAVRSRGLIHRLVGVPMKTSGGGGGAEDATTATATVDWQLCAAGLTALAFGYRLVRALKNRLRARKCGALSGPRGRRSARRAEVGPSSVDGGATELCPICLEPPRIGVRTACDHRMCAACLRRYCEVYAADHKRSRPPPCPLCRTPLVAVTLTYSQINNDAVDTEAVAWIDKFNAARGQLANKTGFLANNALIKLLLAALLLYGVATFQEISGIDLAAHGSLVIAALGVTLMSCLWFGCHGDAMLEEEY